MIGVSVDINSFNAEIVAMQRSLAEFIPKELQRIAITTFAKIRNRIQESGKGSMDELLPDYSLSYKKQKEDRYGAVSVRFRNLTFTGAMWRDHGITSTQQEKTGLVVTISGETQSAKDKARWNAAQIGDFMKVSADENAEVTQDFQHSVDAYAKTL